MIKIYNLDTHYFDNIDTSSKAFWLGFICADGSIKKNRKAFCVKITQKERVLLDEFKEAIGFEGEVKLGKNYGGRYSDKDFYELTVYRTEFAESLMQAGKSRLKKNQKSIPDSVPKEYVIDFIRGYFEGDGTVYFAKSVNSWYIGFSGVEELLVDIQNNIGIGHIEKDKTIHALKAGGNTQVRLFIDTLYYDDNVEGIKHLTYRRENHD